jgi:hypothetical protein
MDWMPADSRASLIFSTVRDVEYFMNTRLLSGHDRYSFTAEAERVWLKYLTQEDCA